MIEEADEVEPDNKIGGKPWLRSLIALAGKKTKKAAEKPANPSPEGGEAPKKKKKKSKKVA